MELKLEVVVLPVSDVDRAKHFYATGLACREGADFSVGAGYRCVQMSPPRSPCSLIFGAGVTSARPGSVDSLVFVVDDIEKTRGELIDRGVDVGQIFHDANGGLGGGF